jgi:dTDP-4-dehydrorhamnose reductase
MNSVSRKNQWKRLLIIGGSGFVGQNLARFFSRHKSVVVTGITNRLPFDLADTAQFFQLDITDAATVFSAFEKILPEVVIHVAGNKNVKYCEQHPDEAYQINAVGTRNVARACRNIAARLIYLSTDLVFSGKQRNYRESDLPHPSLVYGKTKLQGEVFAREELDNAIICRSGGIYGKNSPLLRWLASELMAGHPVECFTDVINSPTYVENLAEMMEDILRKDLSGIFHTVGRESVNRYQFFQIYAKILELEAELLIPVEAAARREKMLLLPNSSLSIEQTSSQLEVAFNSISEGFFRLQKQGGM